MEIGFVGLGKMGGAMVERLLARGHKVSAYARTRESVEAIAAKGAYGAESLEDLVASLPLPRIIWVMVPAGQATDSIIHQLIHFMEPGDCIIDGGNSFYKNSMANARALEEKEIFFLDAGVSGGVWGLENGYCLMVGGEEEAFNLLRPIFVDLAPPGGFLHVGPNGAGHFVKMIHNGIEYGMLQAYAEGFELMHGKEDFGLDLGKIAHLWNQGGVIRSWLLELCENIFREEPDLKSVWAYVEDSGEGRWTVAEAMEQDAPAPVITTALLERLRSRQSSFFSAKVIAALRKEFGGHKIRSDHDE
ncbi:phosphogluconate dehydrogenase (NAD(+)-dependent, decarboxylating) [Desulfatibacillum aliphaticivorans]|uniref:phosphogluconate dehydrogenase (NAD(+)-dependent, decarboxylating) n=1 Tax=Desulfatibacillum aliphaticivorans TaxID=218208 RepID=UPI000411D4A8|nr:decarboxylating 6-phosphogluconate dehydrogenase [Desulfatibacillum aliphaticivorans]